MHWLIAVLASVQFTWGWWMQSIPKQPVGPRVDAFNLHKSVGLTILVLMVARLVWRLTHRPPPLPPMPAWQRVIARLNHGFLYVALIGMPVAGYLGSAFSGYPVRYFGWTLPAWSGPHPELKDLMSTIHFGLSWLLAGAVGLHLAAVVQHTREGGTWLLARMGWGRAGFGVASAISARPRAH